MKSPSRELLQAIAVTAELTGTTFSEPAARVMAADLAEFDERQVLVALSRCRRELRSTLTLAAIIERIDDGRRGPEEAWAYCSRLLSEDATAVWTPEESKAFFACRPLADDKVAARMAFVECYKRELVQARAERRPITRMATLGRDPVEREAEVLAAMERKQITAEYALQVLPYRPNPDPRIASFAHDVSLKLTDKSRLQIEDKSKDSGN